MYLKKINFKPITHVGTQQVNTASLVLKCVGLVFFSFLTQFLPWWIHIMITGREMYGYTYIKFRKTMDGVQRKVNDVRNENTNQNIWISIFVWHQMNDENTAFLFINVCYLFVRSNENEKTQILVQKGRRDYC